MSQSARPSRFLSALVLMAATAAWPAVARAQGQPVPDTWSPMTITNNLRWWYGGFATDGTYLYLFGNNGTSTGTSTTQTRRWDPTTTAWEVLADLPSPTSSNAGAYFNGALYSFGNGAASSGAILRYDIAGGSWTPLGVSLSPARWNCSAAVLNSRIYITGGFGGGTTFYNLCEEFDPATSTFRPMATLPGSVDLHASAPFQDSKVFVMSGRTYSGGFTLLSNNWEFDPAAGTNGTWTVRAPIPGVAINSTRLLVFGDRIYTTGGYPGNLVARNQVYEYEPATNTWTQRTSMGTARTMHAAAVINGRGYVYGGGYNFLSPEEYIPPFFDPTPPHPAADARQSGLLGPMDPGGWTADRVTFSAEITAPDPDRPVRFQVQVRPAGAGWAAATTLSSALGAQGTHNITWTIPAGGPYEWRYRAVNGSGISNPDTPPYWTEFDPGTPDFNSDQFPPSAPTGISPDGQVIREDGTGSALVTFQWTASSDDLPVLYRLQVCRDPLFEDALFAEATDVSATSHAMRIPWSHHAGFYWRVGATDAAGNFSGWSPVLSFSIGDIENKSAGDAARACGFSAGPSSSGAGLLLVLAVVGILGVGRRV